MGEITDAAVVAKGPWLCFHCSELCETPEAASSHFGDGNYEREEPVCIEAATTELKTLVITNREMWERLRIVESELEQAEFERDCWAEAGRMAVGKPAATWHDFAHLRLKTARDMDDIEARDVDAETALDAAPRWLTQFLRRSAERRWHASRPPAILEADHV